MIDVQDLTKVYGALTAVQGLSFHVPAGEILGLVGPNGAGKTTTLRSLAGIIPPTHGQIRIAGHNLAHAPVAAKAALAFIPDEPQLFDYLTVLEHLGFVARLYRQPEAVGRAPELLEELELSDKADSLASELSRGMRQKLAIACGLIHQPRVLILDEPLTGLDPVGIRRMKRTIAARAESGAAVILSSHLLPLVEELCTRVLIIQNGQRVAMGTVAEIAAGRPEFSGRGLEDLFLSLTGHGEPPSA
ncbi:MAG: ABC transporter ATP-binding protein [Gemmatimonadetes bacterium]|nr:ABC transporter ATP-binding protein [Gemmatimonadota bacterium]MBK7348685.1 ABC transporter ATP-binding protein [Gemmatimonadota bacterium]MBK7783313.1 ABC transporter ATP-binding protein [Gemmatimonadota bacterium]MBP9200662.1 ABC transporter ATP-binding protein [Gemmatimonadales bacterium]